MRTFKQVLLGATAAAALIASVFFLSMPNVLREASASAFWHHGVTTLVARDERGFTAWGDSLTAGYGASFLHDFPTLITLVYGRPVTNEGVPKEISGQIKTRFLARRKASGPERVIIWAGRNNAYRPDDVLADIRAMVADLNPDSNFLILGIVNADKPKEYHGGVDWEHIVYLNEALAKQYGDRFLPVRELLLAAAAPRDRRDIDEDIVPNSLRSDDVHLNDEGQALVAAAVEGALHKHGW